MAMQLIPGQGLWIPSVGLPSAFSSLASLLIDATGEKIAMSGRVFFRERTGTKDIERVGFRFGTVTKAGGSGLTVSLQDVSLTAGQLIPDETQDQTVAIANGNASFATNTWIRTGTLSANRTVSFGERLSVVFEFNGSGRLGSDAVNISTSATDLGYMEPSAALKTAGTWASQGLFPNVALEFSDGTFGSLDNSHPASEWNVIGFNSGTAGSDEYALEFTVPWPCKVDGAWWICNTLGGSSTDAEIILYDGTTPMTNGTITLDGHAMAFTGTWRPLNTTFPGEVTLAANTVYRLALRATTVNDIYFRYFDVNDANHLQAASGGTTWRLTSRLNQGAWAAATTTRRPLAGIRISSFDDGAGGGGGGGMIGGGNLSGGLQ